MAFEKYTARGKSYAPKASIWTRGQVGLSQGAVNRLELLKFAYVVMYYDKENNKIGLSFTNNEQEEGIAKMRVRQNGATFMAKSFLDFYNIDYRENKQYDITLDDESKLYIIDLNKPNK